MNNLNKKRGLVVSFCAPSQSGKDWLMAEIYKKMEAMGFNKCRFATVYKIRDRRQTDPEYIKCVNDEKEIDIDKEFQLRYYYGDSLIVYDRRQFEEAIKNGEIIFFASCDPSFCELIKSMYKENSFNVYIRTKPKNENQLLAEEINRKSSFKINLAHRFYEADEKLKIISMQRNSLFEKMKQLYIEYVKDKENGADYIAINYFNFFGGDIWNTWFEHRQQDEILRLANKIENIYQFLQINSSWRSNPNYQLTDEERLVDPLNLVEEWEKYLETKELEK